MSEDIIVVGIVFGSILAIVVCSLLFSLIKTSIKSKKGAYDDEAFGRMAKAFIQHKKNTERRLQNLETIVTGEEDSEAKSKKLESTSEKIEIETRESKRSRKQDNSGNLKNILKE